MQENNRFFLNVWRVNALAIAAVFLSAGLFGLYALLINVKDEARNLIGTKPVTIKQQQPRQEDIRLGFPIRIPGSPIVRVPLYREQKTNVTFYSKSTGANAVNELFVNSINGQSLWLFNGEDRLIVNQRHVLRQLQSDQPEATSIFYTLVEKDSSGDERLSFNDRVSVGYSSPEGTSFTPLLDNIERLFSVEQIADDRLMIIFGRNGENRMITYALPNYTIIIDNAVPKLEDKP